MRRADGYCSTFSTAPADARAVRQPCNQKLAHLNQSVVRHAEVSWVARDSKGLSAIWAVDFLLLGSSRNRCCAVTA